jgi:catalase
MFSRRPDGQLSHAEAGIRPWVPCRRGEWPLTGLPAAVQWELQMAVTVAGHSGEFSEAEYGDQRGPGGETQQVDGAPSVLYDAVAVLTSAAGAAELAREAAARDFVTDAYAHGKFIGYAADAAPLLDATGISELRDDGFIELTGNGDAASFISTCRRLRFWGRQ